MCSQGSAMTEPPVGFVDYSASDFAGSASQASHRRRLLLNDIRGLGDFAQGGSVVCAQGRLVLTPARHQGLFSGA